MQNTFRQTGAFLLISIVFLMAAGGAMLYAMSNLSSVTSTTAILTHNGNMALTAAQSGLKYCVAQLETGACVNQTFTLPPTPAPCNITINDGGCFVAAPGICTITSTASCPNATAPYRGTKSLSIRVQKTAGGYQMIPATRQ